MCEICPKLTLKTTEDIVLMSLLLTSNKFHKLFVFPLLTFNKFVKGMLKSKVTRATLRLMLKLVSSHLSLYSNSLSFVKIALSH